MPNNLFNGSRFACNKKGTLGNKFKNLRHCDAP